MSYVYFVRAGSEAVKIGMCRDDPPRRVANLQTGNHLDLELIGFILLPSSESGEHEAMDLEKAIHDLFRDEWLRGEWFRLSDDIAAFIERHATKCGEPTKRERAEHVEELLRGGGCGGVNR